MLTIYPCAIPARSKWQIRLESKSVSLRITCRFGFSSLSAVSHSDLAAHPEKGTGGTVRADSFADVFAERNQQRVDLDPIAARKFFLQFAHRLFGRASLHVAPAIDDAMDVDIDADATLSTGDPEGEV